MLNDPFECGGNGAGWTLAPVASPLPNVPRKVIWAVDKAPPVGTPEQQAAHQCTMNFNNDTNYCDGFQQGNANLCLQPAGIARSPLIDWSNNFSGMGVITYDIYYDVDPNPVNGQPATETPRIIVREAGTNAVLTTVLLPKNPTDLKVWKPGIGANISQFFGKKFYIEFDMANNANQYSNGNAGSGIFVDNIKVQILFLSQVENCADSIDNDGNGKIDCADPACAAAFNCTATKLVYDDMDCTTSAANWIFAGTDTVSKVNWGVDNTPATPPKSGACTLNYNNGTNYDAKNSQGQSVSNAGTATWGKAFDTTGMASVVMSLWYDYDTEQGQGANFAGYDNAWIQLSTDDFLGCCNVATLCNNTCNTANTQTYPLAKPATESGLKQWMAVSLDLTAHFANKKGVKFRIKFDTLDQQFNAFPGLFIDDVRVYGK